MSTRRLLFMCILTLQCFLGSSAAILSSHNVINDRNVMMNFKPCEYTRREKDDFSVSDTGPHAHRRLGRENPS